MTPYFGNAAPDEMWGPDLEFLGGASGNSGGTTDDFGTAGNVAGGAGGGGEIFLERVERGAGAGAGRKLATAQQSHGFSWDFSLLAVPLNPMLRSITKNGGVLDIVFKLKFRFSSTFKIFTPPLQIFVFPPPIEIAVHPIFCNSVHS